MRAAGSVTAAIEVDYSAAGVTRLAALAYQETN